MLIDITEEISKGKYDIPKLSFKGIKIFGRRVYVKIGELIVLGHIQYTNDKNNKVIIVYISFIKDPEHNIKIKEYKYENGMDLILYLRIIRKDILEHRPQTQGYKWSFIGRDLL